VTALETKLIYKVNFG